ncbi:MAG: secretin N-terminal domain-containing protein [Burkholderiales bacterium]
MIRARIALAAVWIAVLVAGCGGSPAKPTKIDETIAAELGKAAAQQPRTLENAQVQEALLPPLKAERPGVAAGDIEPRFDISVNSAPAAQVFMSIVSGTRYSMLLHPDVGGRVTVMLKDTTVREALEVLRELYGYEYRIEGTRIFVQPASIQTRVFRVNYMVAQRLGRSDIRVTSGSVADAPGVTGPAGLTSPAFTPAPGTSGAAPVPPSIPPQDSSRIQTSIHSDFWGDLQETLTQIVGKEGGRSVVVNPQAGVVVVRAMPGELRQVKNYLREIRLSVDRQVMLEAKIVEVTLSQQFQSGVNWALFSSSGRSSAALINPGVSLSTTGTQTTPSLTINSQPGAAAAAAAASAGTLIAGVPGGALLGLAFQTPNFAALLQFLESQGTVQVLSSPRIATVNNQKAVLKVGTDEFFITGIAGGSTTSGTLTGATTTFPTLTLRPFFTGVALDITPQIDSESVLIIHVHPSVSNVQQDDKNVNLGAAFGGQITLPLARSTVSETDSVVRVRDGNIVAIGGLMKLDMADNRSGLPGLKDEPGIGGLFRSDIRTLVKKELVILIKPTVIQSDNDWADDVRESRDRILNMGGSAAPSSQR